MYMKRPNIPDEIYQTIQDRSRDYENSWRETLERILEQEADIPIKSKSKVKA